MKQHNLKQGSAEWLAHRRDYHNASDAPAMMGCSPYKTRDQLLHERYTGMTADVGDAQQRRFDSGHRFEALARPLAEEFIGEELYPVIGTSGKLSASFDGLTMNCKINYEHKSLNDELRECFKAIESIPEERRDAEAGRLLPRYHQIQMEHQHIVSDAEKTLFMASKWKADDLEEEQHCWYFPDANLAAQIVAGWEQFDIDLAAYVPPDAIQPAAVATPKLALPAVSITVNGSIALIDNLAAFGTALTAYIEDINLKPETDQDFADLDGAAKTLKKAEDALEAGKKHALGQTESIDTMVRTVDQLKELCRKNRLMAEKLYANEKESRKAFIVLGGRDALVKHVNDLNASIGKAYMPLVQADFPNAAKGLKTIASIQGAVNNELARAKIEANAIAECIRANLKTLRELGSEHVFLFSDTASIVLKAPDDLTALVKSRIHEHQVEVARKEEETRERIRAEEQAKAEKEAREKLLVEQEAERNAAAAAKAAEAPTGTAPDPAMQQVHAVVRAATPAPVPAARQPVKVDTPPTLTLGRIGTRLGFNLTATFLSSLGFEGEKVKGGVLFHEHQFIEICDALDDHIVGVRAKYRVTEAV